MTYDLTYLKSRCCSNLMKVGAISEDRILIQVFSFCWQIHIYNLQNIRYSSTINIQIGNKGFQLATFSVTDLEEAFVSMATTYLHHYKQLMNRRFLQAFPISNAITWSMKVTNLKPYRKFKYPDDSEPSWHFKVLPDD